MSCHVPIDMKKASQRRMLAVCPTMGRFGMFERMFQSFKETSVETDLCLVLDASDPQLEKYQTMSWECRIVIIEERSVSAAFNAAFKAFPDYDFYHMTNDDVIYHTKEWDLQLMSATKSTGIGVAYPDDGQFGKACCTFPVISGEIVRKAGWLMLPSLKRLHGDIIWQEIGRALGVLHYKGDVLVEHLHFINKKRLPDQHNEQYDTDFKQDKLAQNDWIIKDAHALVLSLRTSVARQVIDPQAGVKVLLAVPTMGIHPNPAEWLEGFLMVIEGLKRRGALVGVCFPYRMPWEAANNLIFKNALDGEFDYVLRMDDDVHHIPSNAVDALFDADKPVVGAIYPMRHFPFSMTAFIKQDPADSLVKIFNERRFGFKMPEVWAGVQKVDLVGFGLTLIKMRAIKHIPQPMFKDIGGCPDDSIFCQKCFEHGVEVFAHMDIQLHHRHVTPYNNLYLNNAEARFALKTKAKIADPFIYEKLSAMFGTDGMKDDGVLKMWGAQ